MVQTFYRSLASRYDPLPVWVKDSAQVVDAGEYIGSFAIIPVVVTSSVTTACRSAPPA